MNLIAITTVALTLLLVALSGCQTTPEGEIIGPITGHTYSLDIIPSEDGAKWLKAGVLFFSTKVSGLTAPRVREIWDAIDQSYMEYTDPNQRTHRLLGLVAGIIKDQALLEIVNEYLIDAISEGITEEELQELRGRDLEAELGK